MINSSPLPDYNLLTGLYKNRVFTTKKGTETTQEGICEVNEVDNYKRLLKAVKWNDKNIRRNDAIISKNSMSALPYFNPFNIIPCQIVTLRAMEAAKIRLKETHMFTIIEGRHETNNIDFRLDLNSIKGDIKQGLEGYNYIGMVELAYFKNAKHKGGELIAPHFQGVMWGKELKKSDKKKLNSKFSGGRNGAIGFKPKTVYDIVGAVAYMYKLPMYGYKLKDKYSKKSSYSHSTEYLKYDRLYFLYDKLRGMKIPDMLVAGGQGVAVRDNILRQLKQG